MKSVYALVAVFFFVVTTQPLSAQETSANPTTYRASDNTLFVLPTGQTVPKGTHQLNSFQLFFVGYNYGITDRFQVGGSAFFPLNLSIFRESLLFSAKYHLYSGNKLDVSAMAAIFPANGVTLAVSSATYTLNRTRLHGGLGTGFSFTDPADAAPFVALFGADHNLSHRVSLMVEYATIASTILVDDANGLFTFGARFHFEQGNIDFGAMRPTSVGDAFFAFPFLRGTIEF